MDWAGRGQAALADLLDHYVPVWNAEVMETREPPWHKDERPLATARDRPEGEAGWVVDRIGAGGELTVAAPVALRATQAAFGRRTFGSQRGRQAGSFHSDPPVVTAASHTSPPPGRPLVAAGEACRLSAQPTAAEGDQYDRWLDPSTPAAELLSMLTPLPADLLEAVRVGPAVNKMANDGPECLVPAG